MIKIKNIYKKYHGNIVVKNISYKFDKGLYLITGASGKGKTTLLNIMSGKDKKYEGKVQVDDPVLYFKDKNCLPSNLTVKEVLYLFEQISKKKIEDYFEINDICKKKIKKLSLGEVQLVILTIVLNSDSKVIMIDEPFSALSTINLKKASVLLEQKSKDKLIIIATHNKTFFKNFNLLDLDKYKPKNIKENVINTRKKNKKGISFNCHLLYLKKTLMKKIIFVFAILITIFNYFYIDGYTSSQTYELLVDLEDDNGFIIERYNQIKKLDDNIFYEIVKKISKYAYDYNANYYNSKLYDKNIIVDNYYVDNGFSLSSINYIEEPLLENEIIMGVNYKNFCRVNKLVNCDENYLKTKLVNKKMSNYKYIIKDIFNSENTVFLSNKRFNRIYEENEYEEYYFDIKKVDENYMFEMINNDDFLLNFQFVKIGEDEESVRYMVDISDNSNFYYKNIDYSKYIVCLDKGYDCSNYLNHFDSMAGINNFKEVNEIDFKVINKMLTLDEVVISSKLAQQSEVEINDNLTFYFNYNNKIIPVDVVVKDIISGDKFVIYHNSNWSYYFFKEKVGFENKDLTIKNIVVYDKLKKEHEISENQYQNALKEVRKLLEGTNAVVSIINISVNAGSVLVIILIECFYNRFKKEYFAFLNTINC